MRSHLSAGRQRRVLAADGCLDRGAATAFTALGNLAIRLSPTLPNTSPSNSAAAFEYRATGFERRERAGFVGRHQPAVLDDVGREDRGNLSAVPAWPPR